MSTGAEEGPDGDAPGTDSAHERTADGGGRQPMLRWACDLCGGPMRESHCKLICDQCGYIRDCSDP